MKILLLSATLKESEGVLEALSITKCLSKGFYRGFSGQKLIDILVSGPGTAATTDCLTRRLNQSRYDLVMNIGICGSFKKDLHKGEIVNIVSETWGDLGAEDHDDFLDLFDLGLLKRDEGDFTGRELVNPGNLYSEYFSHFPRVKGLTVNKAHGKKESIEACIKKYNPDIESMEGIAVFIVCLSLGINFQCLRSISNFVEPRNRSDWDTETAFRNLTTEVKNIISAIRK